MKKSKLIAATALFFIVLSGCQAPQPYDYSALRQSQPRSILVIPPVNNSVDVNAPYVFLSTITRPLAEKGYYVYPVSVIDNFFKENGLSVPEEMNVIPREKIREHIGADSILYVIIREWGQKYEILSSRAVVDAQMTLVDARTGETLWSGIARAEQQSDDGNQGLLGALVNAIVTQIAGSLTDRTPALSSMANKLTINNTHNGLLNGPYAPVEQTIAK